MSIKYRDNNISKIYAGNEEVFKVISNHDLIWFKDRGNLSDWRCSTAPNGQITLYEYIGSYNNIVAVPFANGTTTINNYNSSDVSNAPFYNNPSVVSVDLQDVPFVNNDMSCAFSDCYNIRTVGKINDNVTNMCQTFFYCPNFNQNIQIPNSVTDMSETFFYCSNLNQNIQIPNSVTDMADTFSGCTSLNQNIKIPNSVTTLPQTFYGCTNLNQNIQIPNSVTNMYSTFSGCNLNQNIQIPSSVINMYDTFYGCNSITSVTIDSINVNSAHGCFSGTSTAKNVYLPFHFMNNSITTTYSKFRELYGNGENGVTLRDTSIVNSPLAVNWEGVETQGWVQLMKYIGDSREVVIPSDKEVTLSSSVFSNINNLTSVDFREAAIDGNSMSGMFRNNRDLVSVVNINQSITNMAETFSNCHSLISTQLPNSVINLYGTFSQCGSYNQSVQIPESATNISFMFSGCGNFNQNVQIPNSVVDMHGTFQTCASLNQNIQIPSSVNKLTNTFLSCGNLTGRINVLSENVTDADSMFFATTLPKDVYIPYNYTNGERSQTFNSFVTAGYLDSSGASTGINGVTMHDLNAQ